MSASEPLKPDSLRTLCVVSGEKQALLGLAAAEATRRVITSNQCSNCAEQHFPEMSAVLWRLGIAAPTSPSSPCAAGRQQLCGYHQEKGLEGSYRPRDLRSVVCSWGDPQFLS